MNEQIVKQKDAKKAICAKLKTKRRVEKVNEKPHLRTRIWMGVSVSQWETTQLFRNYCPCVGKSKDCGTERTEKKVFFCIGYRNSLG